MNVNSNCQLGHIARSNALLIGCNSIDQLMTIVENFLCEYANAGVIKFFSNSLTQCLKIKSGIPRETIKDLLSKSAAKLNVQTIDDYLIIRDEQLIIILQNENPEHIDTLQDNITYFADAVSLWLKRNDINETTSSCLKQLNDSLSFSMQEVDELTSQITRKGQSLIVNAINLSFDQISMLDIDECEEDKLKGLFLNCSESFSQFLTEVDTFTTGLNQHLLTTKAEISNQKFASKAIEIELINGQENYEDVLF